MIEAYLGEDEDGDMEEVVKLNFLVFPLRTREMIRVG